jgi:hypothetical protein
LIERAAFRLKRQLMFTGLENRVQDFTGYRFSALGKGSGTG